MLHISLLCSINAAVCCNQGMYSIDTPSRSIQHKKIPPSQNFYTYCKDLSYKSPRTVYFTITQHNCCSMQQPRHDFDRYPFQINVASKTTPIPKLSCMLKRFFLKNSCAVYITIMQHKCCSMQQPRHNIVGCPFQICSASIYTPISKFLGILKTFFLKKLLRCIFYYYAA